MERKCSVEVSMCANHPQAGTRVRSGRLLGAVSEEVGILRASASLCPVPYTRFLLALVLVMVTRGNPCVYLLCYIKI
jgi:hypothetical protein